jgi:hypothetical protein
MSSYESFKQHIGFDKTLLSDKQCKALYSSVVISSNWNEIYQTVSQTTPLPTRLQNKISSFLKDDTRFEKEHMEKIGELIKGLRFENMDAQTCKKTVCSKSKSLTEFANNIESLCSQSMPKMTGQDMAKMYLSLVIGGPVMFENNSETLRYKERKAMSQTYKKSPIVHDPLSISSILSFVEHE